MGRSMTVAPEGVLAAAAAGAVAAGAISNLSTQGE